MLATVALDAMTGGTYTSIIAGKYHDARSAIRLIREIGEFDECLEARGGYETRRPSFGDFVIYESLHGVTWPHRVPAVSMGGDRVILPLFDAEAIGLAPLYAVGRILRVMRVPCLKL